MDAMIRDAEYYVDAYLKTISIPSGNTEKLFAIGFVGLNGSGKSTVARQVADRLHLYVASNDAIRRWLNVQGFAGASPEQELMQKIAEASSRYLYAHKISHIIDNDLKRFHTVARSNAHAYGAELFLVEVHAPEDVILERLSARASVKSGQEQSRVGVEEYVKRKQLHASLPMPDILLSIDTSTNLEPQIDSLVAQLKAEGYI